MQPGRTASTWVLSALSRNDKSSQAYRLQPARPKEVLLLVLYKKSPWQVSALTGFGRIDKLLTKAVINSHLTPLFTQKKFEKAYRSPKPYTGFLELGFARS